MIECLSRSHDLGEDVRRLLGPDERFRVIVVVKDVFVDRVDHLLHVAEDTTTQTLVSDVAEEALNHIQPRGARGGEVDMEATVPVQPPFHLLVIVGGIVVADEVYLQARRHLPIDEGQELEPFLMPVARHAGADHVAGQRAQRGEQGCRPVPLVVVALSPLVFLA